MKKIEIEVPEGVKPKPADTDFNEWLEGNEHYCPECINDDQTFVDASILREYMQDKVAVPRWKLEIWRNDMETLFPSYAWDISAMLQASEDREKE